MGEGRTCVKMCQGWGRAHLVEISSLFHTRLQQSKKCGRKYRDRRNQRHIRRLHRSEGVSSSDWVPLCLCGNVWCIPSHRWRKCRGRWKRWLSHRAKGMAGWLPKSVRPFPFRATRFFRPKSVFCWNGCRWRGHGIAWRVVPLSSCQGGRGAHCARAVSANILGRQKTDSPERQPSKTCCY